VQVLAISRELASKMTDEQLENHISPREVFVFFWKKPRELAPEMTAVLLESGGQSATIPAEKRSGSRAKKYPSNYQI